MWRALFTWTLFAAALGLAGGCASGGGGDGDGYGNTALQGSLCVDPDDACCCGSELNVATPPGPTPCRYGFAGTPEMYTFELVTQLGASVLPLVSNEAACGADGGWYVTMSETEQFADLCSTTCSRLRSENGRIRGLLGCPTVPC